MNIKCIGKKYVKLEKFCQILNDLIKKQPRIEVVVRKFGLEVVNEISYKTIDYSELCEKDFKIYKLLKIAKEIEKYCVIKKRAARKAIRDIRKACTKFVIFMQNNCNNPCYLTSY